MTPQALRQAIEETIAPDKEQSERQHLLQEQKAREETRRYLEQEERERWLTHSHTVKVLRLLKQLEESKVRDSQALVHDENPNLMRSLLVEAKTLSTVQQFLLTGNYINE